MKRDKMIVVNLSTRTRGVQAMREDLERDYMGGEGVRVRTSTMGNSATGFFTVMLCCMVLVISGCTVSSKNTLTILYTGDTLGSIDLCGCSAEVVGGLTRRAGYIKSIREQAKNILVVDAGNVFSNAGLQEQLKADLTIESMGAMGYDALNLGDNDFVFGADYIIKTARAHDVPVVSANIVYADSQKTIAAPSHIVTFDGLTVGVTGVAAKKYTDDIIEADNTTASDLSVTDETEMLQAHVARLRAEVDVVVVAANVGLGEAKTLAKTVEGIDVIIAGHGIDEISVPLRVNGVAIVKAGYFGENIGNIRLTLDTNKKIISTDGELITLDADIEEDTDVRELFERYYKSLEGYKDELFDIPQQEPAEGGYYAGGGSCESCHGDYADSWRNTPHARALDSLAEVYQDYNPECVDCHVTGLGYLGGFERPDLTPELAGVQCEMCHGPGGEHVENGAKPSGAITFETCIKCHTETRDPAFDFETDKGFVDHNG